MSTDRTSPSYEAVFAAQMHWNRCVRIGHHDAARCADAGLIKLNESFDEPVNFKAYQQGFIAGLGATHTDRRTLEWVTPPEPEPADEPEPEPEEEYPEVPPVGQVGFPDLGVA